VADQYAHAAEWGSDQLHTQLVKQDCSETRHAIFRRQQTRARDSLVSLVDAFLGGSAREAVEDALDMLEAATLQREDASSS
jgi:hypothetical protein